MRNKSLREFEMDAIISAGKSITANKIEFRPVSGRKHYYKMKVPVVFDGPYRIDLIGNYNVRLGVYSFSLLCNSISRIRCLDVGPPHYNPDKALIPSPHKHKWTDKFGDEWAYCPNDITLDGGITTNLREFLAECNIAFNGEILIPSSLPQLELDFRGLPDSNVAS